MRAEVWFSGKVQGVGFRYETATVAKSYDVCGTVENLPDGRVYLVAEGEREEVEAFLCAVGDQLSDYIRETEKKMVEATGGLRGFRIRR